MKFHSESFFSSRLETKIWRPKLGENPAESLASALYHSQQTRATHESQRNPKKKKKKTSRIANRSSPMGDAGGPLPGERRLSPADPEEPSPPASSSDGTGSGGGGGGENSVEEGDGEGPGSGSGTPTAKRQLFDADGSASRPTRRRRIASDDEVRASPRFAFSTFGSAVSASRYRSRSGMFVRSSPRNLVGLDLSLWFLTMLNESLEMRQPID